MKKYIVLLVAAIWAFSSCVKEESVSIEEKNGIALTLVCSDPDLKTKAGKDGTKPGEDPYNENLIKTIDYFFYQEGKTNENSVFHNRISNVNDNTGEYTENITVDASVVNSVLFANHKNTCFVAVLVNYPDPIDHSNSSLPTTLADIEAMSIVTNFKGSAQSPKQEDFVMFGTQTVNLINGGREKLVADPVVDLNRVASKITVDLHVKSSVITTQDLKVGTVTYHDVEQEWEPVLDPFDNLKIYLQNAVKRAIVSGESSSLVFGEDDYFKYSQTPFTSATVTHNEKSYFVSPPFYTYPQTWEQNSPTEPFIKIVLPWRRLEGQLKDADNNVIATWPDKIKQYYYRVILPNIEGFKKNNWYHLILDVEVLGSETDDKTVDITGQYYVVDWKSASKDVEIKSARYLSVSQTEHVMYNTTELTIPYVTSHPCSIVDISVKQYDFNKRIYNNFPQASNWIKLEKVGDQNVIKIIHDLNNDITSSGFDVAPYEYEFTIRHSDSPGGNPYYQLIKITQYPAIYIAQETTTHNVFINGTSSDDDTRQNARGNNNYFLGTITARDGVNDSGDNTNPRQYTVHVTVLDNPDWYIGDPRVATGSTLSNLPTALDNYKPAAENVSDVIAPVFKVASSYGKSISISYEQAVRRCAAYQENGYPAGRWRLPTAAEIEFLVTLSNKGKIPVLFGAEVTPTLVTAYWTAGNFAYDGQKFTDMSPYTPSGTNTGTDQRSYTVSGVTYRVYPRCVYDVWYWDDNKIPNPDAWSTYTWD